jgi:hypothetical protein
MKKARPKKRKRRNKSAIKPDLATLVRRITRENRHPEIDFGPSLGREHW